LVALGQRLRDARLEAAYRRGAELSQTEVARALGVSGTALGSWEAGQREPTLETIYQLAALYKKAPGWLAYGEGYDVPPGDPRDWPGFRVLGQPDGEDGDRTARRA
jgi:transcriptional regulator with XRE-family HTH domain